MVFTNVRKISDLRGIERGYYYVRFVLPPLQEQSNDSGYDFIASLFYPSETDTVSIFYTLKNPDGTVYCNIGYSDEEGFSDSLLSEKIFIYFPDSEIYGFFCKKPEEGKPIEVRVGNEWKLLDRAPSIHIDSTSKSCRTICSHP